MMRKVSILVLLAILAFGVLAGCGTSTTGTTNGGNQTEGTTAPGENGGAQAGTIKIGANLELSGGVSSYGQSIAEGIDLAVEEINKAGGINGQQLEVVKVDNKSDAAESTNAAIKLMSQDKVVAIIGAATSGNTKAMIQLSKDNKIPVITPTGTADSVTVNQDGSVNEYMFRTCFIDPFQGDVAARFALNDLKVKTAAIYIDSASDYSKGLAASFKETFTKNGGQIVSEEAFVAKDTDFRSTLTRIKGTNPEFVYVPGYYEEVGLIVKQARELGLTAPIMGGDGLDSPKMLDLAGADALNGVYLTNHYSSKDPDPEIQKFVEAFKAKYNGKEPDAFSALGYDSVKFLADAIQRAGSADSTKIKDALASTKDLKVVSGVLTIDGKHNPIKSAAILEYKNGVQEFKTKVNP
ncbi:MAG: ABC transporter substrate-binding protein [Thermicanus sp.]|nr:ABC transporter substrate-binding protein [Thermicanus sp.]